MNALAAAGRAGLRVRIESLGSWGVTPLLAEYDATRRTISVDAGAVALLGDANGMEFARRFVECAVWHELYHHAHPGADEAAAHAFARERSGDDPHIFAAGLRAAIRLRPLAEAAMGLRPLAEAAMGLRPLAEDGR